VTDREGSHSRGLPACEEAYPRYRHSEAVDDEAGRVVISREDVRGEAIRTEEYRYEAEGELRERVIRRPGRPPERLPVGAASEGR
jgi:hypothetical protein